MRVVSEELFHKHPKQRAPRYDLRKRKNLPDQDLDQKDPDLVKGLQNSTDSQLLALLEEDFNELNNREYDKRKVIVKEVPFPYPDELSDK